MPCKRKDDSIRDIACCTSVQVLPCNCAKGGQISMAQRISCRKERAGLPTSDASSACSTSLSRFSSSSGFPIVVVIYILLGVGAAHRSLPKSASQVTTSTTSSLWPIGGLSCRMRWPREYGISCSTAQLHISISIPVVPGFPSLLLTRVHGHNLLTWDLVHRELGFKDPRDRAFSKSGE